MAGTDVEKLDAWETFCNEGAHRVLAGFGRDAEGAPDVVFEAHYDWPAYPEHYHGPEGDGVREVQAAALIFQSAAEPVVRLVRDQHLAAIDLPDPESLLPDVGWTRLSGWMDVLDPETPYDDCIVRAWRIPDDLPKTARNGAVAGIQYALDSYRAGDPFWRVND